MIPRLHLVTDDEILSGAGFLPRAREVMEVGGPDVALHIRGPGTGGGAILRLAAILRETAERTGALLLVNDRVDVALTMDLPGVHLGQRSLPPVVARGLLGTGRLLGLSVHSEREAREGRGGDLDYLFVGNIYPTPSHPWRPGGGPGLLEEARAAAELPLVAIGGITPGRAAEMLDAGAQGVAVRGGVWNSEDPGRAIRVYLGEMGRGLSE